MSASKNMSGFYLADIKETKSSLLYGILEVVGG